MPARKPEDGPFQANLYVVGRFLDRLAEPHRTWTKASLQAACGVNYDIFRRYLSLLEDKGYAKVSATGRVTLTKDGATMRSRLVGLLSEFLASPPGAATRRPPAVGSRTGRLPTDPA